MQFRSELQNLQKGGLAMRDYLNKMKTIMDSFALINDILPIRDQILAITAGLGHDYESITVQITSDLNAYKLTDVIGLLFAHEKQLEQYNIHASSVIPTANAAYQNPQKKFSHPTQGNSSQNLGSFHGHSGTKFHGSKGAKGQGYGGRNSAKPQCQLCGKMGHIFLKCYHCFDPFFIGFSDYHSHSHTGATTSGSSSNASYCCST